MAIFELLINTALLVLVWIVQLIIYPGFKYCTEDKLKQWHQIYTKRIGIIIGPLMLSQLFVTAYISIFSINIINVALLMIVICIWYITFFKAIPLHSKIDKQINVAEAIPKLIHLNWIRTLLWTIVWIISLTKYAV